MPCQTVSPSSLGKPRCLQVSAREKGNGEEPFNLFSPLKIQTGSRSLSQEVSALGERAAIGCHLLEMIILHYWKREVKDPCAWLGTGRRAGALQEAGFRANFPRSNIILYFSIQQSSLMCSKGKTKLLFGGTQFTSPSKMDRTWLGGFSWIPRRAERCQRRGSRLQTSHLAAEFRRGF